MKTFLLAFGIFLASICASPAQMMPDIVNAKPPASGVCSQATTYLARTSGGNEGGNSANIATLICGLVTDGVITGNLSTTGCGSTLDALYVLAQQNSTDALLNVCGSNYTATLSGSPIFTTLKGFNGFTTSVFLRTNFNAATATSPNYVQNSANFGVWSYAVVSETVAAMGTSANGTAGESNMFTDYSGTAFYGRINSSTGTAGSVPQPGSKGLFVSERTSSSSTTLYWDGASAGAVTDTSAPPESVGFTIGWVSPNTTGSAQALSEAHVGAALGGTLNLALYTRLRTYMTAVGVP
jgi:hypothetical protein